MRYTLKDKNTGKYLSNLYTGQFENDSPKYTWHYISGINRYIDNSPVGSLRLSTVIVDTKEEK